jgi:AcrR family transcriptional regulator
LRAVAAEAGCTTGLVTSRFPNKRALIIHARTMLHERATENLRKADQAGGDPEDALRTALERSLLGSGFDGRVWLGFLAATVADEEIRAVQVASNRAFSEHVGRLLARARPELSPTETSERATGLVVLMAGLAALSTADPDWYSADRLRNVLDGALRAALG